MCGKWRSDCKRKFYQQYVIALKIEKRVKTLFVMENLQTTYHIGRVIQSSTHQRDLQYGYNSGSQCSCMALFSQFFPTIRPAVIWDKSDWNIVLLKRNEIYQSLNTSRYLCVNDFSRGIFFEGT